MSIETSSPSSSVPITTNTTTAIGASDSNSSQANPKNSANSQQVVSGINSGSTNWKSFIEDATSSDNLDTQKQRLKQLVEQISNQEAKLTRLKSLLTQAREQTAINVELKQELKSVNKSIDEKDEKLRQALNRIDNLNRQLTSHRRTRAYRNSKNARSGPENKTSISNGRRVSFDPLALLLDAAYEGELDLVIQTSKQVPDLSASHDECVTALHNAAVAGHYDVAKYLIENGCDVNVQDSDGWTPLHCAASCNNLPLVKLLIENGASIYATTSDSLTPAMKCETSFDGYEDCFNYLTYIQNNLGVINNGLVYALYDYEAQEEDELSFVTDEELIVLRRDDSEEQEWWWAQKKAKQTSETVVEMKEGFIPRNLVGLFPRTAAYKKARKAIMKSVSRETVST